MNLGVYRDTVFSMSQRHHSGKQGKVWGTTTRVFYSPTAMVEHVRVKAGWRCSKHHHPMRFNQFYVVRGRLKVVSFKDGLEDESILEAGESVVVPPGTVHHFEALSDLDAIEVYWVEIPEPDIVRQDQGQFVGVPLSAARD